MWDIFYNLRAHGLQPWNTAAPQVFVKHMIVFVTLSVQHTGSSYGWHKLLQGLGGTMICSNVGLGVTMICPTVEAVSPLNTSPTVEANTHTFLCYTTDYQ